MNRDKKKRSGRRVSSRRETLDLGNPSDRRSRAELIRQYEDPAFVRASEEYEREALRRKGFSSVEQDRAGWRQSQAVGRSDPEDPAWDAYSQDSVYSQGVNEGQWEASTSGRLSRRERKRREKENRRAEKRRRRSRPGRVFRRILVILLVLVIAVLVTLFYAGSRVTRTDTGGGDYAIVPSVAQQLSGYRNIAILGSDARLNESLKGSRTDAVLIMSIQKKTGQVKMVSVMRDSYLKLKDSSGNLVLDKITHAHAFGGGGDTISALNRSLDLNIKEYVVFNWKAVADTVDALGGITVDVKQGEIHDMNQYGPESAKNTGGTYTRITQAGAQRLNGAQAVTYCRIRYTSGGDVARGSRYRTVIQAVMKEAARSPLGVLKLVNQVLPEIQTNMSQTEIMSLVLRGPTLKTGTSLEWPKQYWGGITHGRWYAVPQTLAWNVKWLHQQVFGQADYQPSSQCMAISQEIIYSTGVQ